jgi:tetratricopeptide (TPR) repeat protein
VRDDPCDFEAYYYMGVSYEAMRDYEQAVHAYKTGLAVRPLTPNGKYDEVYRIKLVDGLARAISKCSSRDAELDAAQAQAQKSQRAWDYFLLAKISRYSGDADNAVEQYNHAILLDHRDFVILKDYGLYLFEKLNQPDQARKVLMQAGAVNQQDPQVASALRQLGVVPGPSLMEKSDMVQPPLPSGPIPPFSDIEHSLGIGNGSGNAAKSGNNSAAGNTGSGGTAIPASSVQAPRN